MEKKSKSFIKLCAKYGVDHTVVPEITSFEKACKVLKLSPTNLPKVGNLPARFKKRLVSDYKLSVIAEAIRGGNLDMSKTRYNAVFTIQPDSKKPSGFGLSFCDFDLWGSCSNVGVRLEFNNWNQATFFGKHFMKEHVDHMLLT